MTAGVEALPPKHDRPAREQWASGAGFLLATIGAAVGLGNIWRFSYVVGENGGGVFILVYLAAVLLIGMPLLLAELAVGRHAQADAATAFQRLSPRAEGRAVGWLGVVAGIAILSYYAVVAGWVARYMASYLAGGMDVAGGFRGTAFADFIAHPYEPVFWQAAILALTGWIVSVGIVRGIEAANRLLMPAFAVLVLALAAYGLTLPGAEAAARFLFLPDWDALWRPRTYMAAIGQALFSIGLGMGVLVTYGSYLPRGRSLARAAGVIVAGDTLIALVAGIMIFAPVFSFSLDPAQGPILAFVVLPEVFAQMPFGNALGFAFFLLLLLAALTSAVALLEVPVAVVMARFGVSRRRATALATGGIFVLGLPSALGHGPVAKLFGLGRPVLDLVDQAASEVLLPISAIAMALFVGWRWQGAGLATISCPSLRWAWTWSLRLVVPAMIVALMMAEWAAQ